MTADPVRSLPPALAALLAIFRPCFKRVASFGHWETYIVGLITDLKRKSIEPIALDQVEEVIGDGVRSSRLTFDEDYGSVPGFRLRLDRLGQRGIGAVRANFRCWTGGHSPPH